MDASPPKKAVNRDTFPPGQWSAEKSNDISSLDYVCGWSGLSGPEEEFPFILSDMDYKVLLFGIKCSATRAKEKVQAVIMDKKLNFTSCCHSFFINCVCVI